MPQRQFDQTDARLLDILQREFPLVERPFEAIAGTLGITPNEVIQRVTRLKQEGVIRQIGAIFDSAALGYVSALVALRVDSDKLDSVAERVCDHEGVSHCYSRDAGYNLWFTLTLPPGSRLEDEIAGLVALDGVQSHLYLPAIKTYKIGVLLDVGGSASSRGRISHRVASSFEANDLDRAAIRALQKDLPLVESPFAELAHEAGISERELLRRAEALIESGIMRRYAAVLYHRRVGYLANAMVCWQVEECRIDEAGATLASHPAVSHCYHRPASPDWPYPLYTMVHCRTEAELERTVSELAASAGLTTFCVLRSVREYKKSRVIYEF